MKHFKILLFDADDTLFDFAACEDEALRLAFLKYGYELNEEVLQRYKQINRSLWKRYEEGTADRNTVIYTRFGILFKEIGIVDDSISFEDSYQELLGRQHFFIKGAFDLVKRLYYNYEMYIVTNGITRTQLRRFQDSGIDQYMKKIFVSEETGSQKPQWKFFDYCFERIDDFDRTKAIIIGDSLSSDIKGGNNAGISTCWYNPDQVQNHTDAVADYEIYDLSELPSVLVQV